MLDDEDPFTSNRVLTGRVQFVHGRRLMRKQAVERAGAPKEEVNVTEIKDPAPSHEDAGAEDEPRRAQTRRTECAHCTKFFLPLDEVADWAAEESIDQFIREKTKSSFSASIDKLESSPNFISNINCHDGGFIEEHPKYVAYTTPLLFVDDWLNIYLDSHRLSHDSDITTNKNEINCSDYRFIYIGVKGTWTPLHADVFRSYSWSGNVCGKKLWLFLPPSQCHLIFDRYQKSLVYDVHGDICEKKFPGFNKAIWWECTQEQNEIIFVPSGWYHQVHNLEDTISINHNWFNGHNLSWVWNLLVKDYNEAKEYIEDIRDICDDFESICQRNLAANTGMNFYDFFAFLTRFALASMSLLRDLKDEDFSQSRSISRHVINNMRAIHSVASSMGSVDAFAEANSRFYPHENYVAGSDAERIMEGPDFRVLCADLGTSLKDIHKPHNKAAVFKHQKSKPTIIKTTKVLTTKLRRPADFANSVHSAEKTK
ncbi:F-box protein [Platanthera guangdongensis]|uniref:F-box protein n=1 Tax=Platanthera guangdongensis TaxID=2320717 RepID=A0ABR2M3R6_9ASPA